MSARDMHLGDQDATMIAAWDADPEARDGPTFTDVETLLASLGDAPKETTKPNNGRPDPKPSAVTRVGGISVSALVGAMVLDRAAKAAAASVWARFLRHRHGPYDIAELVDDEVDLMRIRLSERQLDDLGRGYLLDLFRRRVGAKVDQSALLFGANCRGSA